MKVVCIKIPKTSIKLSINIEDILDAILEEYTNNQGLGIKRKLLYVYDHLGNKIYCDALDRKVYFITLQEYRLRKLSELNIKWKSAKIY